MVTSSLSWGGKTALVTGGTGFVGAWLVRELLDAGANVVVLSRRSSHKEAPLNQDGAVRLVHMNGAVEDYSLVLAALGEHRPDAVFHLAGQSGAGAANKDPLLTLETNVRGTWNLLEACRNTSVARVVVASSDKVYGESSELPYQETAPLRGSFPYDVSKSCADLIAGMYAKTYGSRIAIARFSNVFGGADLNFSRLIPGLIRSTMRGERFVIHSDGNFVRDFLYVRDAVLALLGLAEELDRAPSMAGEAFNFGLGVRVTVLEMVEKILALMGMRDLQPIIMSRASCETRESYSCCEKAERVLGWRPRYGLEEGLRETISWYQHYLPTEKHSVMEAAG